MIKKFAGFVVLSVAALALCSCAPVTITSVPSGAGVYSADGQNELGVTPFGTSVIHGDKSFTVRQPGYFDQSVILDYNSPRTVAVALQPVPVLVESSPPAFIYAQDSAAPIGKTPMKLFVAEEDTTYTLKADGYYDQEITVGTGSASPLTVTLARRPIVTLSATPAGVEVYEKGRKIGTAPVVEEISTSRTFELRKENFFPRSVTLDGAPPYEVSVDLKPFPVITVSATPGNADIYSGGKIAGKGTASFSIGQATPVEVKADRFYPQTVTLTPESAARVSIELKAMPFVTIQSEPSGAQVSVGGRAVGSTPVELLVEKQTSVKFSKEGFVTQTSTINPSDRQISVKLQEVPPPAEEEKPVVPPKEPVKETASMVEEVAVFNEPAAETPEPVSGGSNLLVWGAAAAVVAAGAAALFLIKRKK